MKKRKILAFGSWMIVILLLVIGCDRASDFSSSTSSARATELTISAAASLKDAIEAIEPIYTEENSTVKITYNFGSSGSLQQQIEQGAPVDIFISAAAKQMDALQQKSLLLNETRQDLLTNQIVLITSTDNAKIKSFKDLASNTIKKVALGEPKSVPAGEYAQETLNSLKMFAGVQPKIVYAKDVRQVLNYVATGNADAGFVYYSDAKISDRVKIIEIAPKDSHAPIVYPIAVLKDSKQPEAAKKLVEFLSSSQAEAVFKKYGFTMAK
jgi:molybdate transport system substrate-binding protein